MNAFFHAAAFARELFLPSGCACCGHVLSRPVDAYYGLCAGCREALRAAFSAGTAGKHCTLCGKSLISETGTCMSCRRTGGNAFDRVSLIFPYRNHFLKLLRAWKFGGQPWLGRFLSECLVPAALLLLEADGPGAMDAAWVPVPPRPGKIRKSGWDQVENLARFLERPAAAAGTLPVCRCLRRLPSETQKILNREQRRLNLTGNIRIKPAWAGRVPQTAVLFDDVYTTGSTLNACAAALKQEGARQVYGVCLFYD